MADMHIVDSADRTPAPPLGRHPLTPISGADFDPSRRRIPLQVWVLLSAAVLLPLAWIVWRLDSALRDLFWRYPLAGDAILWLLLLGILIVLAAGVFTLSARAWLSVQQARIIRSRLGVPIDIVQQVRLDPYALEAQAIQLETVRAPFLLHPNLSTLSQTANGTAREPVALSTPSINLVQPVEWMNWLNEDAPHVLLAGPSGSGKTTMARALLSGRIARGDQLCVIDPHGRPGAWPVDAYGAGRDYTQIADVFEALLTELDERYKGYRDGRDDFERLTIVVDEVPAVAAELGTAWTRFFRATGSEARKVAINVMLVSQSALIKDIGSSTSMRENYARLGFGTAAQNLLQDERDPERRRSLADLSADRPHVAMLEWRGRVHVLDLSDVPRMVNERRNTTEAWTPVPRSDPKTEPAESLLSNLLRGSRSTDRAALRDARGIALFRTGATTREVAEQLRAEGFTIANAEIGELRRQALNTSL